MLFRSIRFESDDAGFMRGIKELLDEHDSQTAGNRQEGQRAPESTAGQPDANAQPSTALKPDAVIPLDDADATTTVAEAQGIAPALVEKDYWIMQSLYGLQQLGLTFELKGGTSLSKGYGLISRFSEDIDLDADLEIEDEVEDGEAEEAEEAAPEV